MLVALLKPDVITSGHTDDVVTAIEEEGFTVVEQDLRMITLATAQELYMEHEDKDFYDDVVRYLCSGPVMALLLSKPGDAIGAFRDLMGPTNAERARAEAPDRCGCPFLPHAMRCAVSTGSVQSH
jgi:nucleoside diphosphate kinase